MIPQIGQAWASKERGAAYTIVIVAVEKRRVQFSDGKPGWGPGWLTRSDLQRGFFHLPPAETETFYAPYSNPPKR